MEKYLEIAASKQRTLEWLALRDVENNSNNVEPYDMTNLPIKNILDNMFTGVYSEHFIEHIFKYQGINFFKEMFRILKPGGTIRTVWPSYDFVEKLVSNDRLDHNEEVFVDHYYRFYIIKHNFAPAGNKHRSKREQCALGLLHQEGEHRYLWAKNEMINTLESIGFVNIKEMPYQKSDLQAFNGIETKGIIRAAHSTVIEAIKPC